MVIKMDDCKLIVNILKITFELKNDVEIRMCIFDNILRQFVKFIRDLMGISVRKLSDDGVVLKILRYHGSFCPLIFETSSKLNLFYTHESL